jgi:murein DD-endopeptidase MepM/ murein hydrolase activator NlpD
MRYRLSLLPFVLIAAGCSQRAQWPAAPSPVTAPRQQAEAVAPAVAAPVVAAPVDATAVANLGSLLFPVPGVDSTRLDDSFDAPRDGGVRRHNAIDIMAPRGTPVLAVQDGRILRLAKTAKGGTTVYATDLEDQFVYYYAHLDRYHPSIYAGRPLLRGDTIGYVGTTGNAPKDLPHLHFQVMHMPADHKFWNGDPINPYPLLSRTASRQSGK